MGIACQKDRYEAQKKLGFCNFSIAAVPWANAFPVQRAQGSIIHLERGIALSQVGRDADARDAFERAIRGAQAKLGHWEQSLHERMIGLDDQDALALWRSVAMAVD